MQGEAFQAWIAAQQAAGVQQFCADRPRSWLDDRPAAAVLPILSTVIAAADPATALVGSDRAVALDHTARAVALVGSERAVALADLHAEIAAFDRCALKELAMNTVIADGNPDAGLMVIGEAPGADEDRLGKPFVGKSGQLLDRMLGAIGLERQRDFLITNLVFWRPPGNRKPNGEEVALCLPFAQRQIELLRPRVLLFVGGLSAQTLLQQSQGILRLRGRWFSYRLADGSEIPALPILHPAYLLRQPRHKRETWQDLLALQDRLRALGMR